jgi:hypothetical protein
MGSRELHTPDRIGRGSNSVRCVLLLAVLGLALTACGGEARSFTGDDLPGLVLQPDEAPTGTQFFQDGSGPASAEDLAQGVGEANARWTELGFRDGFVALFRSPDFPLPPPPDPSDIPSDAVLIGNSILLFGDAEAASQALEVQRSVVVPSTTEGAKALTVDVLGEEAVAFTFDSGPVGRPGAIYGFRIGNAMFVVAGAGALNAPDLLAIARRIATRVQRETS